MKINFNSQSNCLPIINGIIYSNGRIDRYTIQSDKNWYRTVTKKDVSVYNLEDEGIIETTACILEEHTYADIGIKFVCGEGSYGGDGFILAESYHSSQMIWLIAFDDSNPFVKLERKENDLFATNNCGEVWRINIADFNNVDIGIVKQGICYKNPDDGC